MFTGADYQRELIISFQDIQNRSADLIQQAQNSHWETTSTFMSNLMQGQSSLNAHTDDDEHE